MLDRRKLLAAISMAPFVGLARAQTWPQRPVKIVYPYAAGSAGDVIARLLAQRLGGIFERPFIVENRVGANGAIGAEAVARSPADGHTLLWAITPQLAISPAMSKVPYDPVKDFAPVSAVCANTFALVVNSKIPARSVGEFVKYVRGQPDRLAYAEGGVGSVSHLAMALFLKRAGLSMTNVTYRGNQPALTDVIAGHVPAMFSLLGDALAASTNGSVRILAVGGDVRTTRAPDVPTLEEAGLPGFRAVSWWGLLAPSNTPKAIIDRLAFETARIVNESSFVARLAEYVADPIGNTPEQFAKMIASDIAAWGEAVTIAGLKEK